MHNTRIIMKDGRELNGIIWTFSVPGGYLILAGTDEELMFKDMVSATTENSRDAMREDGTFGDCDELARARRIMKELRDAGSKYGHPPKEDLIGWEDSMGVTNDTPKQEWE